MVNPFLNIKAGAKYLLSLAKSDWTLTDYPIRFRHFNGSDTDEVHGRLRSTPWSAQIINWWQMDGFGDNKQQAYADLETKFNKFKADGKTIPRPGTGLPIEFAATDRVRLFDDIADDFFRRILDMNYRECFISDESTLWDFHTEESNEHFHTKVWDTYRVDVSDIEDGNLVKVFERIENRPSRT